MTVVLVVAKNGYSVKDSLGLKSKNKQLFWQIFP